MRFRRYPFWNRHVGWFLAGVVSISATFAVLAWNLNAQQANRAVLLASFLATMGWLFTVFATRANERRKITVDLVLRHHMDRSLEDHKYRILREYPPFTVVDDAAAKVAFDAYRSWQSQAGTSDKQTIPPVGYSIAQILNFYEFIAVSVRRGRLDEGVAYDGFSKLNLNMTKKFEKFIALCRASEGTKPSSTFADLVWMTKRWHRIDLDKQGFKNAPATGLWQSVSPPAVDTPPPEGGTPPAPVASDQPKQILDQG